MATRPRSAAVIPDHGHRFGFWCHGPILKCSYRYNQDPSVATYALDTSVDCHRIGLQKSAALPGQSAFSRISKIAGDMWKQEGIRSFYKGITPRVLRVAPGELISLYCRESRLT